jgi:hypothetical protein
MLTLDEAVDRVADAVFRNNPEELIRVYRAYPTLSGSPRKTLDSMLSHAIGMKITEQIKRIRQERIYPLEIENMPAIRRVERKVFQMILARSRQGT